MGIHGMFHKHSVIYFGIYRSNILRRRKVRTYGTSLMVLTLMVLELVALVSGIILHIH